MGRDNFGDVMSFVSSCLGVPSNSGLCAVLAVDDDDDAKHQGREKEARALPCQLHMTDDALVVNASKYQSLSL